MNDWLDEPISDLEKIASGICIELQSIRFSDCIIFATTHQLRQPTFTTFESYRRPTPVKILGFVPKPIDKCSHRTIDLVEIVFTDTISIVIPFAKNDPRKSWFDGTFATYEYANPALIEILKQDVQKIVNTVYPKSNCE